MIRLFYFLSLTAGAFGKDVITAGIFVCSAVSAAAGKAIDGSF